MVTQVLDQALALGRGVRRVAPWQPVMQPVWSDEGGCWCTSDQWVYRFDYQSERLRPQFRLPRKSSSLSGRIQDALARSWLRRRWRPAVAMDTLVVLRNQDIVLVYDQVYWHSPGRHGCTAQALSFHETPALAPPLRGGAAVHGGSQHVYFGEYLNGHQRDIRVLRVDVTTQQVQTCWSFSRTEIKHVHAIHYDPFRDRLWVCTGDLDHESALYYTDDEFQTVHKFGGGDQTWRAIAMWFDAQGVEWGMDAGKDAPATAANRVFRHDFGSGQRSERALIGNPAYAACQVADGSVFLQTSFEPGRQQATEAAATIWHRDVQGNWRRCLSSPYKADPKRRGGQYGALLIPGGRSPVGKLMFSPSNALRCNGELLALSWSGEVEQA
jgi:hypothetical protein